MERAYEYLTVFFSELILRIRLLVQPIPVWFTISLFAIIIRFPMIFLPGAGRDEAIYFYWSRDLEPAYTPLMQLLLAVFNYLPIPQLITLRLPSVLTGIAVLYLLDAILQYRKIPRRNRIGLLVIFAFTPWQIYTGTILHPDNLLLTCILLFLLSIYQKKYLLGAIAAGLAFWTKPSGILLLPVATYLFFFHPEIKSKNKVLYLLTLLGLTFPIAISFHPEMVRAIAEFGKVNSQMSLTNAIFLQVLSIMLLGGILMPFSAVHRFWEQRRSLWDFSFQDAASHIALVTGFIFILAFIAAAFVLGQVKGNWMLPAIVLFWLPHRYDTSRKMSYWKTGSAMLPGILLVLCFANPGFISNLEQKLPGLGNSYAWQAGNREARVSATDSWTQRIEEYESVDPFLKSVQSIWQKNSEENFPKWIISDDYGLAGQLVFGWNQPAQRLIIPDDGIFFRTRPPKSATTLPGGVLVLNVHHKPGEVWHRLKSSKKIFALGHPQTGKQIYIEIAEMELKRTK